MQWYLHAKLVLTSDRSIAGQIAVEKRAPSFPVSKIHERRMRTPNELLCLIVQKYVSVECCLLRVLIVDSRFQTNNQHSTLNKTTLKYCVLHIIATQQIGCMYPSLEDTLKRFKDSSRAQDDENLKTFLEFLYPVDIGLSHLYR
jgi:hypothetical protein